MFHTLEKRLETHVRFEPHPRPVGRGLKNDRPLPRGRKGAGGVNGADRDRTDNLLDATEALSQLSYGPA